jgi:CRP/FNR family transcriptional regulator, cyclic AMP receptor protein
MTTPTTLKASGFFAGFPASDLERLGACASEIELEADRRLFRQGEPADRFFVVREGLVAVELPVPGRGVLIVDTVGEGDAVGISWLFPPARWQFDARATLPTRLVALDAACLRTACDGDPGLGHRFTRRFAAVVQHRLQSARLRLLDLYGPAVGEDGGGVPE